MSYFVFFGVNLYVRGAIQKFVDKLNIFFYLSLHINETFTS